MKAALPVCLLLGIAGGICADNGAVGYSGIDSSPTIRSHSLIKLSSPVGDDSLVNGQSNSNLKRRNATGSALTLSGSNGGTAILVLRIAAYFATIQIGSSNKSFTVWIATTVSDFWIPGSNCTTGGCIGQTTLGTADSTTLVVTNRSWSALDSEVSPVSGVLVHDSVTVGGSKIPWVQFGLASQMGDSNNVLLLRLV
jgi:hypothetical protein